MPPGGRFNWGPVRDSLTTVVLTVVLAVAAPNPAPMTISTAPVRSPAATLARWGVVGLQLALVIWAADAVFDAGKWDRGIDVRIYGTYSHYMVIADQIPYRDYRLEYPPLALLAFAIPHLTALGEALRLPQYTMRLMAENIVFAGGALAAVWHITPHITSRTAPDVRSSAMVLPLILFGAGALLMSEMLLLRFDAFAMLFTALSLLCVVKGRPLLAGLTLGAAVAAKLYPVVLAPIWGAYYLTRGDWGALLRATAGGALALGVTVLPFLLIAPEGLLDFVQYHAERGIQVESLWAGAILIARALGLTSATLVYNYGATHLISPLADAVLPWVLPAFLVTYTATLVACLLRFRREVRERGGVSVETLVAYAVIALLVFVLTNKVFSAQYMLWFLPFAALLPARRGVVVVLLCGLTALIVAHWNAFMALDPRLVAIANMRNALAAAWLVWLAVAYRPGTARRSTLSAAR